MQDVEGWCWCYYFEEKFHNTDLLGSMPREEKAALNSFKVVKISASAIITNNNLQHYHLISKVSREMEN